MSEIYLEFIAASEQVRQEKARWQHFLHKGQRTAWPFNVTHIQVRLLLSPLTCVFVCLLFSHYCDYYFIIYVCVQCQIKETVYPRDVSAVSSLYVCTSFHYLFIHTHSSASALIHLSISAPTCQPPRCVQRQKKYQQQREEIETRPERGRWSAGDGGAAQQPELQGVSRVKCSSKPMKKCLISHPYTRQHCSICRVCVLSKSAALEENQEPSDGLINSSVSPLPASCFLHPQKMLELSCRT